MTLHDPPYLSALFSATNNNCRFTVWAPLKDKMTLHLAASKKNIGMVKNAQGYFATTVDGMRMPCQYFFSPDENMQYPDPASNFQPYGVHGCSQVVDHFSFEWTDSAWKGLPFCDLILYELHVGTFTNEGTFEAIIPRLPHLIECGVNAIELMPVNQFPGTRNWGYDGVFPYAVQNSYGGPEGLKKLVDACHKNGIAVFLDIVYNHLGPEGNYLAHYGPYFSNRYSTPWGQSINFDGEWSDGVRDYFANNALYWFQYFHIDGLRLDAIHMVYDHGAVHFWQYLYERVRRLQEQMGRALHLVAESDLNSPKVINSPAIGGFGFTAQWLDDFHHALYVMLDKKGRERYEDFGLMSQLAKAYKEGFVHSGEYVKFRKRKHGASSAGIPGNKFVVFTSNHDQIGNRPDGGRLASLINFERLKLAAAALILSPYIPMLFMGEEYGEVNPFYYFVSHSDVKLIEAVRKGRREEFKAFKTEGEWQDPQDEKTFSHSVLNWDLRTKEQNAVLLKWYKDLITTRREMPVFHNLNKNDIRIFPLAEAGLVIYREDQAVGQAVICLFNFTEHKVNFVLPAFGHFRKVLDSGDYQSAVSKEKSAQAPGILSSGEEIGIPSLAFLLYTNNVHA